LNFCLITGVWTPNPMKHYRTSQFLIENLLEISDEEHFPKNEVSKSELTLVVSL